MKTNKKNTPPRVEHVAHAELQDAVNSACAAVMFHMALTSGFISGPGINTERCEAVLEQGRAHRLYPQKDEVIRLIASEVDADDPTLGRRFAEKLWAELTPRIQVQGH